jgi:hypothetical protein
MNPIQKAKINESNNKPTKQHKTTQDGHQV